MTKRLAPIYFPSRIGVWWNSESWPIREAQEVAREIEALGFKSLFMPEGAGKDVLVESAAFLGVTDRLVVGTGIANIHFRITTPAEGGARTLAALHPGRFVLGLGVSHAPVVEESMKGTYGKPLASMPAPITTASRSSEIACPRIRGGTRRTCRSTTARTVRRGVARATVRVANDRSASATS